MESEGDSPFRAEDVVEGNDWFVLTSTEDGYALWASGGERPVARFPASDEGAEEAWATYQERTRRARSTRLISTVLPKTLIALLIAGAVFWLVGGTASYLLYTFGATETFGPPTGTWFLWLQVADALGYRLCVGSAAVLVGWFIFRRWQRNE